MGKDRESMEFKCLWEALALLAVSCAMGTAEDWITTDGKTYKEVKVIRHDDAGVTVLTGDGGATIPWSNLPVETQKKLGHDPDKIRAMRQAELENAAKIAGEDKARITLAEEKAKADYASADKTTIKGQVVIVNNGGENIKLGAVHIRLYSFAEVSSSFLPLVRQSFETTAKLKPVLDAEYNNCKRLQETFEDYSKHGVPEGANPGALGKKMEAAFAQYRENLVTYYNCFSQKAYIDALPMPLADAQTGADGKFMISVPKTGQWILEAEGQRKVVGDTENYFWITKISSDALARNQIFLNNENLSSGSSPDSLAKTIDRSVRLEIVQTANYLITKDK